VWPRVALAVAVVAGLVWLAARPHHWRPLSGAPLFAACTDFGYVNGWCADLPLRGMRLHVLVIPAVEGPAQGALLYLEGGPGGAATQSAIRVNEVFARVGKHRDLVMVDQRGTGGSGALSCPDRSVRAQDAAAVTAYLRSCARELRAARSDTTSAAADDLEAVRRALGYGKVDVYGASYGATLAQVYLERHPGSVRTMTLDGGSLPSVRIYDASVRNAQHALDATIARCGSACRQTKNQLATLLRRPRVHVLAASGPVDLRPDDVAWTVDTLSETPDGAASIPAAVRAAAHGNYLELARDYVQRVGPYLDPRLRLAMVWVILCSEPWARFDAPAGDGYLAKAAAARSRVFDEACRAVPRARAAAWDPPPSHVPVLLLAGGADPLDPPANLHGWRRLYPNGRLVVVPGAAHGVADYPCVETLIARFVEADGARSLDTSCARRVQLPPFETG
jgi:pimeloyl-ACP methyl ester carboxylesterase